MLLKTDDIVQVTTGKDGPSAKSSGKRGKILRVDREKNKVVVENVGLVYKHVRPNQKNPQGGRLHREMPVNASNVMFVCGSCDKPTRLGVRFDKDGQKERFCKRCNAGNGAIGKPKKK